jgi:D-alanine transaminase
MMRPIVSAFMGRKLTSGGGGMKTLGYYNGDTGPLDQMRIPMNDRACWFGDGVYDAAYCASRVIFALDEHMDRFFNSASLLQIKLNRSKAEIKELLRSLVQKTGDPNLFVYWQVTRGTAPRSHVFPENTPSNLWITLTPVEMDNVYKRVTLITEEDKRFFFCHIKTLNLLPNVLASEKAKQAGAYEAVFHRGGRVTECAHSNVHILKDGVFRTAPADNLILPGIGRAHLIRLCGALGIPVDERPFTVGEMMEADEIIISSAGKLCTAADRIDGKAAGGKAPGLLRRLQDAAREEFQAETGSLLPDP